MTEDIENRILEHLRVLRSSVDGVGESLNDLKARVGQIEEHIAGMRRDMSMLHADIAITHKGLDGLENRVERIEKRLELVS